MLNRFLGGGEIAQEVFEGGGGVFGGLNFLAEGLELQAHAGEHLFVGEQLVEQLLPVENLAVVEHEFERDILQEQVTRWYEPGRSLAFSLVMESSR